MISALFILDVKGRVIINRDYRGDVSPKCVERFMNKLNELEGDSQLAPIIYDEAGVSYIYLTVSNLILLAVTRTNTNVASVVVFLNRLVDVFKHYFHEVEEESLRDNFVIVYELLDEVMDHGYPQFTEAKILSEFIKTDAYRMESVVKPPMAVTNAVHWRNEGIKYSKNEVFLDAIESVNLLVNSNGSVVHSEVAGVLRMRVFLSGMPECKLGLNDKILFQNQGRAGKQKTVELEDIKFHQCVRLARFENDRTISFIPPDGNFDLMSYRLSQNIKPLISVECFVDKPSRSRTEYLVQARSQLKERSVANNVEIILPLPPDATRPQVKASQGTAVYVPEKSALVWTIKSFAGGREFTLRCNFNLPSVAAEDDAAKGKMPPIRVKFEIPYYTVSGIQVRYLKVIEKSGYQALPWVRYITTAGNYEIRMH
uniref:MHD domain-containing protein n=1 Tax=Chlamydomonas euryale TaxID=1486919 RepID=A0A7R9V8N0_9CHLO|mmetsp:Transcript_24877/g.73560  ORF Transcript_24877/g.73560 Transcript_24877/m.73560 type:complete len:427 (+) Transcript_24877:218-1498(+)